MVVQIAKKRKITPEIAVQILNENGTFVSLEEAAKILDLMYKFAKLSIDQQFKSDRKI
jgi:hypothetical protein